MCDHSYNCFCYSLQCSLSKEEDIKRRYEAEMQKLHMEKVSLTDQLEHALQEEMWPCKSTIVKHRKYPCVTDAATVRMCRKARD